MSIDTFKTMSAVVLVIASGIAEASILTFDDVTTNSYAFIQNGYGELNWDNMSVIDGEAYWSTTDTGYTGGLISGSYVAYNELSRMATASVASGTFNFLGAYLSAAWNDGLQIDIKGYNSGSLLYDTTVVVNMNEPIWFDFNFNNIDQLTFNSYGGVNVGVTTGKHFVMDNLSFVVPLPPAVYLFGFGLFSLIGLARRKTLN